MNFTSAVPLYIKVTEVNLINTHDKNLLGQAVTQPKLYVSCVPIDNYQNYRSRGSEI